MFIENDPAPAFRTYPGAGFGRGLSVLLDRIFLVRFCRTTEAGIGIRFRKLGRYHLSTVVARVSGGPTALAENIEAVGPGRRPTEVTPSAHLLALPGRLFNRDRLNVFAPIMRLVSTVSPRGTGTRTTVSPTAVARADGKRLSRSSEKDGISAWGVSGQQDGPARGPSFPCFFVPSFACATRESGP